MGNLSLKIFELGPVGQEDISFELFLIYSWVVILYSREEQVRQYW